MKLETFLTDARRLLCAFGALVLVAGAPATLGQTGVISPGPSPHETLRAPMMGMMKSMDAVKMTGDTDRDFAMMMKAHHQGAIELAQFELERGTDPQMRAMAKRIIEAQQKEIGELDRWLGKRK